MSDYVCIRCGESVPENVPCPRCAPGEPLVASDFGSVGAATAEAAKAYIRKLRDRIFEIADEATGPHPVDVPSIELLDGMEKELHALRIRANNAELGLERAGLTWRKEPPTEPGYYWGRYLSVRSIPRRLVTSIIHISADSDGRLNDGDEYVDESMRHYEWAGPIAEPTP